MVKYLIQDRHPVSYRAVSHDPKEKKFYEHTRTGGPGSPKEKRNEINKDDAHRIVATEHPAYQRQRHESNISKYLQEHQLPHWGDGKGNPKGDTK